MNKNIILSTALAAFICGFLVAVYLIKNDSNAITSPVSTSTQGDYEYYKYLPGYLYMLEEKDYEEFMKKMAEIEKDEQMNEKMTLVYVDFMFKEFPEYKEQIDNVINNIKSKKTNDNYFDKNTSCVALEPGIKERLSAFENLEVIFYSPTLDSCLYVINKTENDYIDKYAQTTKKEIYKAGSSSLINSFRVYKSGDYDNPAEEEKSKIGTRDFIKFILENSNYNMSLLEDSSFVYVK